MAESIHVDDNVIDTVRGSKVKAGKTALLAFQKKKDKKVKKATNTNASDHVDSRSVDESLSTLKVAELREKLTQKGLDSRGNKPELFRRLADSILSDNCSQAPAQHQVSCKCGVVCDDGHPMVQCSLCNKWSHLDCYGLSSTVAIQSEFKCVLCSGGPIVTPPLAVEVCSISNSVSLLKENLAKQIRSFNSQFLSLRDQIQHLSSSVNDTLYRDVVAIFDNLNVLNQKVDSLMPLVSGSANISSSQRLFPVPKHSSHWSPPPVDRSSTRHRSHINVRSSLQQNLPNRAKSYYPMDSPPCAVPSTNLLLKGIDISNSPLVIGRLIS